MRIFAKMKPMSGGRRTLVGIPIEIDDGIENSNELISNLVTRSVRAFNEQATDRELFACLTGKELSQGVQTGKIGFGDKKNDAVQDEKQAVENALQCFQDGIFRLYIGEDEIGYDQPVTMRENDELTLIRLTMLAGRLW